jgi:hypothetical protein
VQTETQAYLIDPKEDYITALISYAIMCFYQQHMHKEQQEYKVA